MSITDARANAVAWKKTSLEKLKQTRALVREFNGNLNKLCNSVKVILKEISRKADQIGKQYDKYLEEESAEEDDEGDDEANGQYEQDSDTMTFLQEVPDAAEVVDDTKLQTGESLESLLAHLDGVIAAVQEIKP